ncbi:MAG: type VI secretion system baseplate subunit TssK [Lentisphaeraceae bacterium]|nr:type VI secretion system baseplate subunit TssK [Lentisphaeraceae bacterium]
MSDLKQLHWHEGLFIQPHHFQVMQRSFFGNLYQERSFNFAHPNGMVHAEMSNDALENMIVQFNSLKAVMPSGTVVSFPGNSTLPSLDIKQAFRASTKPLVIYLAVPLWQNAQANTVDGNSPDWMIKRMYSVEEQSTADENSGINEQMIPLRNINARLMLEETDHTGFERMPILRLMHSADDTMGYPKLDGSFVPPSLVLKGSKVLYGLVKDLSNQLEASRDKLVEFFNRNKIKSDQVSSGQFDQVFRLRILSLYSARLSSLMELPNITPFEIYMVMKELHAELTSLEPEKSEYDVPDYDHDNLSPVFFELNKRIRGGLRDSVKTHVIKVDFTQKDKLYVASLKPEHFKSNFLYFLGIKTKEDPGELVRLVENGDQFKLISYKDRQKAIYGVHLKEEKFPSLDLPSQVGLSYFRLLVAENNYIWEQIQQEKEVVVKLKEAAALADMEVALYILPLEEYS